MGIEISSLVAAVGGQVVGKIRLQKTVYLLDALGMGSGFSYSYHHYGPYSSQLSDVADIEAFFGELKEEQRSRVSDGVPYSVFSSSKIVSSNDRIGHLTADVIKKYSDIMSCYSATELELAATAYWIAKEEEIDNWAAELKIRKGIKTENGRKENALKLLNELGLRLD